MRPWERLWKPKDEKWLLSWFTSCSTRQCEINAEFIRQNFDWKIILILEFILSSLPRERGTLWECRKEGSSAVIQKAIFGSECMTKFSLKLCTVRIFSIEEVSVIAANRSGWWSYLINAYSKTKQTGKIKTLKIHIEKSGKCILHVSAAKQCQKHWKNVAKWSTMKSSRTMQADIRKSGNEKVEEQSRTCVCRHFLMYGCSSNEQVFYRQ